MYIVFKRLRIFISELVFAMFIEDYFGHKPPFLSLVLNTRDTSEQRALLDDINHLYTAFGLAQTSDLGDLLGRPFGEEGE